MDTHEYVVCRLCGKNFKMITLTHLMKAHNMNLDDYKKEFPDANIICGARREEMGRSFKRKKKAQEHIIEEETVFNNVEELEEKDKFSEDVDEQKEEVFQFNKKYRIEPVVDKNEIEVNTFIKSLYPHAVEDYVIVIKNGKGEILHEFVTDISVPNEKIIFDFPNSFFHNSFPHTDNVRNKVVKDYGWEIITIKERMPKSINVKNAITWNEFEKASKEDIYPNTNIIDNI